MRGSGHRIRRSLYKCQFPSGAWGPGLPGLRVFLSLWGVPSGARERGLPALCAILLLPLSGAERADLIAITF